MGKRIEPFYENGRGTLIVFLNGSNEYRINEIFRMQQNV